MEWLAELSQNIDNFLRVATTGAKDYDWQSIPTEFENIYVGKLLNSCARSVYQRFL